MYDAAVLSDPAYAAVPGEHALLHRTGVDVRRGLEWLRMHGVHPRDQSVKSPQNDVVVIIAPGVAGHVGRRRVVALQRVRTVGVIERRRDNDAPGAVQRS